MQLEKMSNHKTLYKVNVSTLSRDECCFRRPTCMAPSGRPATLLWGASPGPPRAVPGAPESGPLPGPLAGGALGHTFRPEAEVPAGIPLLSQPASPQCTSSRYTGSHLGDPRQTELSADLWLRVSLWWPGPDLLSRVSLGGGWGSEMQPGRQCDSRDSPKRAPREQRCGEDGVGFWAQEGPGGLGPSALQ